MRRRRKHRHAVLPTTANLPDDIELTGNGEGIQPGCYRRRRHKRLDEIDRLEEDL